MKGRTWLVLGTLVGIGIAAGRVPYLAGAARSLSDDAQRVVGSGGSRLISAVGHSGASDRIILGLTATLAILVPGLTALLLVVVARGARMLRTAVAIILVGLGAAAFAYQPNGDALGAVILALIIGAAAVVLSGPLVMLPLCALAGLIGGEFLPRLLSTTSPVPNAPVSELHLALFGTFGTSSWLRAVVLIVAAIPFVAAAGLVIEG